MNNKGIKDRVLLIREECPDYSFQLIADIVGSNKPYVQQILRHEKVKSTFSKYILSEKDYFKLTVSEPVFNLYGWADDSETVGLLPPQAFIKYRKDVDG